MGSKTKAHSMWWNKHTGKKGIAMSSTVNTCSFTCNNLFSFLFLFLLLLDSTFTCAANIKLKSKNWKRSIVCSCSLLHFHLMGTVWVHGNIDNAKRSKRVKKIEKSKKNIDGEKQPSKMRKTVTEVNNKTNVLSTHLAFKIFVLFCCCLLLFCIRV